ncbi:MAG: PPA1309 family protein, partial [Streptomyces sp.]
RDGTRESALRLREKDASAEVLTGAGLVPGLAEALAATFEE